MHLYLDPSFANTVFETKSASKVSNSCPAIVIEVAVVLGSHQVGHWFDSWVDPPMELLLSVRR